MERKREVVSRFRLSFSRGLDLPYAARSSARNAFRRLQKGENAQEIWGHLQQPCHRGGGSFFVVNLGAHPLIVLPLLFTLLLVRIWGSDSPPLPWLNQICSSVWCLCPRSKRSSFLLCGFPFFSLTSHTFTFSAAVFSLSISNGVLPTAEKKISNQGKSLPRRREVH